jgi:hypothetical protein
VGLVVKYQQLARQVGVLIEDPPANSMALFNFIRAVLEEGTTFTFGSSVCIANGLGSFNNHLANPRELEVLAVTQHNDLDEFVGNLDKMQLPDLAREIEE